MTEPSAGPIVAVVQARLGSRRMPGKVLSHVLGTPALKVLLDRLGRSELVNEIVLAIPEGSGDDPLAEFASSCGVRCVRGSETDVLDRYRLAAELSGASVVVRITADCPMVDPLVVDEVIQALLDSDADYARTSEWFPDGFDVEALTATSLLRAADKATEAYDREHVTSFVRSDPRSSRVEVGYRSDFSGGRVTLDEPEDLVVIGAVFDHFGDNRFTVDQVTELMGAQPALFKANRHLLRNEGALMGMGQKLWRRARRVIPGGNMLLSKRAEQFLPEGWPAYFSRASGCSVWDLDGVEYIDVGLMGVGTNILGYGHPKVDEAVRNVVAQGNLSTLNCPEEVELAERLVELHPWADMAKFTRSGGEAGAVAIRIARAASGKSAVAICGYHGWHDWYLSANLADDAALDGHLLPGLEPNGVPRNLQGLTRPFVYNDLPALERILAEGDVGVVIMEVERSTPPDPGFLESVRSLTTKHDAVLIFDECTSGFRKVMGGLHLHYGVEPDMAIFGKTLGNGYAINAVIGRESVMRSAEATFISSTFWTERIGPAAALAALNAMADEDAPRQIDEIGLRVRDGWRQVCEGLGLGVSFSGLPALSVMSVEGVDAATFRPFLTEQMLASGYLAGPAVYASVAHSDEVLHHYFDALEIVLDSTLSIGNTEGSGSSSNCACPPSGFGRLA